MTVRLFQRNVKLIQMLRFKNDSKHGLVVVVEPWASEYNIVSGSEFAFHYPLPKGRDDLTSVAISDGHITIWCEGPTYDFEIDGEIVD